MHQQSDSVLCLATSSRVYYLGPEDYYEGYAY